MEGYLFPATYRFAPTATPEEVLAAMLERFFTQLTPQVEQRAFDLGLSTRELVTLASMIEKEAKVPAERPLIASVFYNRLRMHMPLQSDPTAQYSFEGITGPAAQAVHTPSAFNTYDFAGLPPGPIANPGLGLDPRGSLSSHDRLSILCRAERWVACIFPDAKGA